MILNTRPREGRSYLLAAAVFFSLAIYYAPAGASESKSAHFTNSRSSLDSAGRKTNSASFVSTDAVGEISLTSHFSTNYISRSGLMPIYFFPGKPAGFSAAPGTLPGQVLLSWTAPGNDGQQSGTAARAYLIKRSSDPAASPALSEAMFAGAGNLVPPPTPGVQGAAQSMTAVNLLAGNSYYFALRGLEADLLPGALSDAVTAYAQIVPPGVMQVSFSGLTNGDLTLSWSSGTASSGYNPTGTSYRAELSTSPTFATIAASSVTTGLTNTLSGLSANTTYYAKASAFGTAVATSKTDLGGLSTLTNPAQGAQLVCRTSASSATATWLQFPSFPQSAAAEGFVFEVSTAANFTGTLYSSTTFSGAASTLTVTGLSANTNYFYRLGSLNWNLTPDYVDLQGNAVFAEAVKLNGQTGFRRSLLSWDALPSTGACAVVSYNIYRSTTVGQFSTVTINSTATYVVDGNVLAGTTYFYQLAGVFASGQETPGSTATLVFVHSAPPLPPFGLEISSYTPTSIALSWKPVPAYVNRVNFDSYIAPRNDEVLNYAVYRATAPTGAMWNLLAKLSSTTWNWTDVASGPQYFYRVIAENVSDTSYQSIVVSQANQTAYAVAPDDKSYLSLSRGEMTSLAGAGTDPSSAYLLSVSNHPEALTGNVLKSIEVQPMRGGLELASTRQLSEMALLQMHYDQNAAGQVQLSAAGGRPQAAMPGQLSVFWYNGQKWLQLYGTLDARNQVVSVQVKNFGRYELRAVDRAVTFNVDPGGITNKFITPNGDGKNDNAVVTFANNSCSEVTGKIYDMKGAFVSSMSQGPIQASPGCLLSLAWDGQAGGRAVPGGVYVYQIEGEGKTFNGTFVVIR
ncbi:MAG: gliding motility-associated C-terminal domain-containing protein [Elusimicrobia bacterium]|nr:gliding motility-associated C-terminal domain-containing protein [Elusimicrobiota bacterium]